MKTVRSNARLFLPSDFLVDGTLGNADTAAVVASIVSQFVKDVGDLPMYSVVHIQTFLVRKIQRYGEDFAACTLYIEHLKNALIKLDALRESDWAKEKLKLLQSSLMTASRSIGGENEKDAPPLPRGPVETLDPLMRVLVAFWVAGGFRRKSIYSLQYEHVTLDGPSNALRVASFDEKSVKQVGKRTFLPCLCNQTFGNQGDCPVHNPLPKFPIVPDIKPTDIAKMFKRNSKATPHSCRRTLACAFRLCACIVRGSYVMNASAFMAYIGWATSSIFLHYSEPFEEAWVLPWLPLLVNVFKMFASPRTKKNVAVSVTQRWLTESLADAQAEVAAAPRNVEFESLIAAYLPNKRTIRSFV